MELTAEQYAKFKELCRAIQPGEYGRVEVSFIGSPSNVVQIIGEKNYRFHNQKAEATRGTPQNGAGETELKKRPVFG
jgi:hypothetical protein